MINRATEHKRSVCSPCFELFIHWNSTCTSLQLSRPGSAIHLLKPPGLVTADKTFLRFHLIISRAGSFALELRLRRIASCYGCYGWHTDCISKRSNSHLLAQVMNEWFYRAVNWMLIKITGFADNHNLTSSCCGLLLRLKYTRILLKTGDLAGYSGLRKASKY